MLEASGDPRRLRRDSRSERHLSRAPQPQRAGPGESGCCRVSIGASGRSAGLRDVLAPDGPEPRWSSPTLGGVEEEAPSVSRPVVVRARQHGATRRRGCGVAVLAGTQRERRATASPCRLLNDRAAHRYHDRKAQPYGDGRALAANSPGDDRRGMQQGRHRHEDSCSRTWPAGTPSTGAATTTADRAGAARTR